jgi:hypothetical protein
MSQNLIIVARNPQPKRELYHPDLWLLYTPGERPVEVRLSQDTGIASEWVPIEAFDGSLTW